jgi:hypothetical protein
MHEELNSFLSGCEPQPPHVNVRALRLSEKPKVESGRGLETPKLTADLNLEAES